MDNLRFSKWRKKTSSAICVWECECVLYARDGWCRFLNPIACKLNDTHTYKYVVYILNVVCIKISIRIYRWIDKLNGWKNVTYTYRDRYTQTHIFCYENVTFIKWIESQMPNIDCSCSHHLSSSLSSSSSWIRHSAWHLSFFLWYCHFCHCVWRLSWTLKAKKKKSKIVIQSESLHNSFCRLHADCMYSSHIRIHCAPA